MNEIVVDGCNAMHRLRLGGPPGAARAKLVAAVLAAAPRGATVWFDGHAGAGALGGTDDRGVAIRFSGAAEADDAIVEHVRAARRPRTIVVVTDDLELARRVEQLGASSLRVGGFLVETEAGDPETPSQGGGLSAADFGLPEAVDLDRPPPGLASGPLPGRRPARPRRLPGGF